MGRDEVPGCSGTDGISAPTFKDAGHNLAAEKTRGAFSKQQGNSKHVASSKREIPRRAERKHFFTCTFSTFVGHPF